MTKQHRQKREPAGIKQGCIICGTLFLLLLFLTQSQLAAHCLRHAMKLCVETVIPSLFPFFVLSSILLACGGGDILGRLFVYPMQRLFGIPGAAATPALLGALCGFPIGAKSAAILYDSGQIDREELTYLLTFCNNAGIGFVVSAVGARLWNSPAFGLCLYGIQLLSALLIGLIGRRQIGTCQRRYSPPHRSIDFAGVLTRAIPDAVNAMCSICGFVLFFSVVVGAIGAATEHLTAAPYLNVLLFSFVELTSGVCAAASLDHASLAAVLTAFTLGWSGLSVHLQVMTITAGRGLSYRRYLFSKLAQGLLCAALTALLVCVLPLPQRSPAAVDTIVMLPNGYTIGINLLFVSAIYKSIRKKFAKIR